MFWTVLALALTVLMGGIIAYYGDLIGRKYGKKRLSWFGLRPKYTAILITSISGALISSLTMAAMFLLVKPVRDIILQGEQAIRLSKSLERKNQSLKIEVARNVALNDNIQKRLAQIKAQLAEQRIELQGVHAQLAAMQSDRDIARRERDTAKTMAQQERAKYVVLSGKNVQLENKNGTLASDNARLASRNKDLAATNISLTKDKAQLISGNERLAKFNDEYTKQNEEFGRQNEQLARENGKLIKDQKDLIKAGEGIAQRTADLTNYNAELERKNRDLLESSKRLVSENAELTQFLKRIAPGYKSLQDAYSASRIKRVVVHKDEDLARVVIPSQSTPEAVRAAVQNLLSDASQVAVSRGAAPGDQARAVQVANRVLVASDGGEDVRSVSGDDRVDELVRKLAYQQSSTCLQAIAVANSVEDEPAAVELVPKANREVFSKGQQVAVYRVNSKQDIQKLFDDVVGFLRTTGQAAVQQGMIPRVDSSGEPQVGSLTAAEIAKLVEKVREYNGYVHIRAVAAMQINAADPLALSFKVEP
jgi:uncharacterized protein (DUF3084 family)